VKVNNFGGNPNYEGVEQNNAMRGMLSRNVYLSSMTNQMFVGKSARLALDFERSFGMLYLSSRQGNPTMVHERTIRGLPLKPEEVKKLCTIYYDCKWRFNDLFRVEAYLLLWKLYTITTRVMPQHRNSSTNYLLQPDGFDNPPPLYFPCHLLQSLLPLLWGPLVKQTASSSRGELMNPDPLGLYLQYSHHPGSLNLASGVAFDFAYQLGRCSLFRYTLSRLLSPVERETTHTF
jgi:hypothetical protein